MAVVSLLCVLLPLFALIVVGLPAVLDLVTRPESVPVWWSAPLALFIPFVLGVLTLPTMMDPGMDRVLVPAFGWGMLHLAAAAMLLTLATGLAFSRGLRPGGDTLRRRRTSLAAIAVMLGVMCLPWLPGLFALIWVIPAAWAGLFWVVGLNRKGPLRMERGKAVSASLLFAAALSFLIGMAHTLNALELSGEGLEIGALGWIGSVVLFTGLAAGLRWLTGPPAPAPVLLAAGSGVSLLFPAAWSLAFQPVPSDVQAPEWVDFEGVEGPPLDAFGSYRCLEIHDVDGNTRHQGPSCPAYYSEAILIDARAPLDRLTGVEKNTGWLLGDGRHRTQAWERYADPVRIRESNGQALLYNLRAPYDAEEVVLPLGPELTRAIRVHTGYEHPLSVQRSSAWTMQDFVSMCASMRDPAQCSLE